MRWADLIQLLAVVVALGIAATPGGAQNDRLVLSSGLDQEQTHGWAVYRSDNGEILLAHLPPRDAGRSGPIETPGAEPGRMQAMRPLGRKLPLGIGCIEERVYLVFPKTYTNTRRIMRVYSARAVPSPVGAMWSLLPHERLETEPAIETDGELMGLVATSESLWALLDEEDGPRLLTLDDGHWRRAPLPGDLTSDPGRWRLVAVEDKPLLVEPYGGQLIARVWNPSTGAWTGGGWSPIDEPRGGYRLLPSRVGLTLVQWNEGSGASIDSWTPAGLFRIAGGLDFPPDAQLTGLESVNRLIAVARRSAPDGPGAEPADDAEADAEAVEAEAGAEAGGVVLWEIDLSDGSAVFHGPPVVEMPVSVNEFRFLVGMMILVMVGVLVVVIMPDRHDTMRIPDGFALADPGRRLLATMLDVGLLVVLMGETFDVEPGEIITLGVIMRSDGAWLVIPAIIVSGVIIMSLFEWLLGATPGKLLLGVRVVRAESGAMQRPALWSALVRNTIKWILPPVAALALVDPEMLHRGDRASRSVVAYPLPEGPAVDDQTDSDGRPGP